MTVPHINRFEWMKAALQAEGLSPTAKNIVSTLAVVFANDETGQCNPSQETLADYLKVHRDTIKRALRELRNAGWLASMGDGGRGKAPLLRFLTPSKVIHFDAAKAGQITPKNDEKGGANHPAQGTKRGEDLQQKGGQIIPPLYNAKQSLEQKGRTLHAFSTHKFAGNICEGLRAIATKDWSKLNPWADWLRKQGLPELHALGVFHRDQKGNAFFRLPYLTPPDKPEQIEEARRFFTAMLDEQAVGHAAQ
ncbi:helix-turn-helix domain-containing protein [Pseudoprimorskyibacter insulae]|uniref:Helix-turn-helix domain-containing protein n=1 Tax=Pseudoprimorskyibacter insulae TaxID=1695997 RepID=A0A2R8B0Z1_9RHOB|nr:helix-turn-helix domain-containing protein [Pseudoprimorskyibacter insulae]SPF81933.1 hypothetical protein PRI8871_03760 [Pseudoprimorskyibacter insulae]